MGVLQPGNRLVMVSSREKIFLTLYRGIFLKNPAENGDFSNFFRF
jgi:hypothetical protein